uniref:Uncharacterized protein n=1 Tax=Haemonchus contortus TaxID=6289 RepID=A0A7I4YL79_HAECO
MKQNYDNRKNDSALVTPTAGKAEPLKVHFSLLRKWPVGIDNEPVQTVRKKDRPKKSRGNHSKTACFRVDVEPPKEDPLHLFHPSTCKIFRTKVQTALPSLRSEVVEELTGPARGFDARVVDAFGTNDTTVPLRHPATGLGTTQDVIMTDFIHGGVPEASQKICHAHIITTNILSSQARQER